MSSRLKQFLTVWAPMLGAVLVHPPKAAADIRGVATVPDQEVVGQTAAGLGTQGAVR
jgi:hypothetical protein